jgi:hypothetical protein
MPLRVTGRIERYLTAPKQLIYNQKFRAECIRSWFLQQTAKALAAGQFPITCGVTRFRKRKEVDAG